MCVLYLSSYDIWSPCLEPEPALACRSCTPLEDVACFYSLLRLDQVSPTTEVWRTVQASGNGLAETLWGGSRTCEFPFPLESLMLLLATLLLLLVACIASRGFHRVGVFLFPEHVLACTHLFPLLSAHQTPFLCPQPLSTRRHCASRSFPITWAPNMQSTNSSLGRQRKLAPCEVVQGLKGFESGPCHRLFPVNSSLLSLVVLAENRNK